MYSQRVKRGIFIIEGLNSFVVTFYFYYFYFFTQTKFGFGNKTNLIVAAVSGLICVPAAIFGGRFGQRRSYFTALKVGFAIMFASLSTGWLLNSAPAGPFMDWMQQAALSAGVQFDLSIANVVIMLATIVGMSFTWANLEALVSEGKSYAELQRNIGIYNVVWAATGAIAYFIGGALLEELSLNSIFFVPVAILLVQFVMTVSLQREATASPMGRPHIPGKENSMPSPLVAPSHATHSSRAFLRMAWLANPFSYIALNTLIAVMPGVAARLNLSTTLAGFCCSIWCFARLGAFVGLWFWPGWHYRFRWLLASYLTLLLTFAVILMVPSLAVVITAQILLGGAVGLIYYSSLFYSMDVGETKGEHGGIHEAAIGLGNFAGPAVGAISLHFLPQVATSGAIAVSLLLACGLGGLLVVWRTTRA